MPEGGNARRSDEEIRKKIRGITFGERLVAGVEDRDRKARHDDEGE